MPDRAGYDREAHECAADITAAGKRVLLVHGRGAAERDAFVERRLAPFLEARGRMFGFVRPSDGAIIPASNDPARAIGTALRAVVAGRGQIGPVRRPNLGLGRTEMDAMSMERPLDGSSAVDADRPGITPFHILEALTRISPDTIILAVSDPMAPARPDPDDPFVSFLRTLGETQIDAKVIVTVDAPAHSWLQEALAAGKPRAPYVVHHRV